MKIHRMQLPREVVVGRDVAKEIGKVCKRLDLHGCALQVLGTTTKGLIGRTIESSLQEEGFETEVVIVERSSYEEVNRTREIIRKQKVGVALGIGGGKNIDVAKLSSCLEGIPFIAVPTVASHDGIVSPNASIKGGETLHSTMAEPPLALVADTTLILKAPYRYLTAGAGDIISNWTAVKDWKLGHQLKNEYYGEYAASLSKMSASMLLRNSSSIKPNSDEAVRLVLEALISSGVAMGIAGSSRPASGAEHKFSHALDKLGVSNAFHGEQCGLGSIMMEHLHGGDWRRIRRALEEIGAPVDAEHIGVNEADIIEALTIAHTIRPERYTILGNEGLTRIKAEKLARETMVI